MGQKCGQPKSVQMYEKCTFERFFIFLKNFYYGSASGSESLQTFVFREFREFFAD